MRDSAKGTGNADENSRAQNLSRRGMLLAGVALAGAALLESGTRNGTAQAQDYDIEMPGEPPPAVVPKGPATLFENVLRRPQPCAVPVLERARQREYHCPNLGRAHS